MNKKIKTPKKIRESETLKANITTMGKTALSFVCGPAQIIVDGFCNVYTNCKREDFDEFLNSFYLFAKEGQRNIALDDYKIQEFFSNKSNNHYLSELVESALFSHSKNARVILGYLAAKYLMGDKLDYVDLIIIKALKDLFDYEVNIFINYAERGNDFSKKNFEHGTIGISDVTKIESIAFCKLASLQLFAEDDSSIWRDKDGVNKKTTEVTERLLKYIIDTKSTGTNK